LPASDDNRLVRRWVVAVVLVVVFAAGCGGHGDKSAPRAAAKAHRPNPVILGPGKPVDIGGGRSLYLYCLGSGSPTVVLFAGGGGSTDNWSAVQPQLGHTTRVCAYDRAGSGYSPPNPRAHDAGDEIDDLQRLLDHAHLAPPYVLVGHSYGGLVARLFAHVHPREAAGVVLVDAMGRSQDRRFWRLWRAQPSRVRRAVPNPLEVGADQLASEALADRITTLGNTPLAVITRGRPDTGEGPLPARLVGPVQRLWLQMQDELASLSSDQVHVVALRSGHFVQAGQPLVVIRAVRTVVHAARTNTPLPPCPRLFPGSGVRCRS
jgi:pimeloyl-ACP methyl ester carboxylesterase